MAVHQNTVALIFDFDDTLTDDSITVLLQRKGISARRFWTRDVASLVKEGWDPPLAYMKSLLNLTARGQPLDGLTRKDLRRFGRTLRPYPRLEEFLQSLRQLVRSRKEYRQAGISIEYYIISGGLEEIINSARFRRLFTDVWGSSFHSNPKTGRIEFPKNAVTFTDKTRFLFQINKGVVGPEARENPNEVNREVPAEERPIPFSNMIYVGDGLTDIPCFSLVERERGHAFGIFHPEKADQRRWKKTAWNLLSERRTKGVYRPIYKDKSDLGYALRLAVEQICRQIVLKGKQAL